MNNATQKYIADHENDDIFSLSLSIRNNKEVDHELAIRQIRGRQKIKHKVSKFYNCSEILYPSQLSLEQSSSEATASYKSTLCKGNSFVDLTGGFGVDCSFMSQNFSKAIYVEQKKELCELANHNFKVLGIKNIEVINDNAINFLQLMSPVDLIYLDPARRDSSGKKVFKLTDCEPDITSIIQLLKAKAQRVMVKLSPMIDLMQVRNTLDSISEIHIISVENECKELVLIIEKQLNNNSLVKTININKKSTQIYIFDIEQENLTRSDYSAQLMKYLYEPNTSIMKAGAFKSVGQDFKLFKLHVNTHLYTSNQLITDFPGRIFEIREVFGGSKSELNRLKSQIKKANISIRNFSMSVDDFRKKTGIIEGGDQYLFACKSANENYYIINCSKLSDLEMDE